MSNPSGEAPDNVGSTSEPTQDPASPISSPVKTPVSEDDNVDNSMALEPAPLAVIYPGDVEAPIEVEEEQDIAAVARRTIDPNLQPSRVSGRIFKQKISGKRPRSPALDDVSYLDDSSDKDYSAAFEDTEEVSFIPQAQDKGKKKLKQNDDDLEEEIPLEQIIAKIKQGMAGTTSIPTETEVESEPMVEEVPESTQKDESPTDTTAAAAVLESLGKSTEGEGTSGEDVVQNVGVTSAPTSPEEEEDDEPWNLPSRGGKFYSSIHKDLWPSFQARNFKAEKMIDVPDFDKQGVLPFLLARDLDMSFNDIGSYPDSIIREVYSNLSPDICVSGKRKYGRFYLRGKLYQMNPTIINKVLGTPNVRDGMSEVNMNEVVTFITGGRVAVWDKFVQATKLTSLYSILFKLSTHNWLPTSNDTKVQQSHAKLLYFLGKGVPVNLGQLILRTMASHAEREQKGILPFPGTIWKVLKYHKFQLPSSIPLVPAGVRFTISPNYLHGSGRVNDLPWTGTETVMENVGSTSSQPPVTIYMLQEVIQFLSKTIDSLIARRGVLQALLSSQKGGEIRADEGLAAAEEGVTAEVEEDIPDAVVAEDDGGGRESEEEDEKGDAAPTKGVGDQEEESEDEGNGSEFRLVPRKKNVGGSVAPTSDDE